MWQWHTRVCDAVSTKQWNGEFKRNKKNLLPKRHGRYICMSARPPFRDIKARWRDVLCVAKLLRPPPPHTFIYYFSRNAITTQWTQTGVYVPGVLSRFFNELLVQNISPNRFLRHGRCTLAPFWFSYTRFGGTMSVQILIICQDDDLPIFKWKHKKKICLLDFLVSWFCWFDLLLFSLPSCLLPTADLTN